MTDPTLYEDLKAYLDGELDAERAEVIRAAIEQDPQLAEEANAMNLLGFEIRRLATTPDPVGLDRARSAVLGRESIWEKIAATWNQPRKRYSLMRNMALASVLALGVLVSIPMLNKSVRSGGFAASTVEARPADLAPASEAVPKSDAKIEYSPSNGTAGAPLAAKRQSSNGFASERSTTESVAGADSETPLSSAAPKPPGTGPRMVIKNGSATVRVEDSEKALRDTESYVVAIGGFVSSSNATQNPDQTNTGSIVVRIPSAQFESALRKILSMGEKVDASTTGDDVTGQYTDTQARIKIMKAEEDSLVTMLRAANKVNEMLSIKEQLMRLRAELDSLEAQAKMLKDQSSLSTISVTYVEKPKIRTENVPSDPFGEAWTNAINGLNTALTNVGQFAIRLFVYSPLWGPPLLLIWWLNRKSKRQVA